MDVPDWHGQLTETVKILLVHHRRKQRELATALGLTPQAVSRSMTSDRAHRRTWQIPDLIAMADFFEVNAEDLARGDLAKLLGVNVVEFKAKLAPAERTGASSTG
jgi:predicted transcriptional regulator